MLYEVITITEQTYYRWRKQYGGMQVSQAKRLKELEFMKKQRELEDKEKNFEFEMEKKIFEEKKKLETAIEEKFKENSKKEMDEKMEKIQEEFRKKELEYHVITSYSIHYTKLYESINLFD